MAWQNNTRIGREETPVIDMQVRAHATAPRCLGMNNHKGHPTFCYFLVHPQDGTKWDETRKERRALPELFLGSTRINGLTVRLGGGSTELP